MLASDGFEIGLSLSAYQRIEGTKGCYLGNQFWELNQLYLEFYLR